MSNQHVFLFALILATIVWGPLGDAPTVDALTDLVQALTELVRVLRLPPGRLPGA